MEKIIVSTEYQEFIESIKERILHARHRAVHAVNTELINLYYAIGKQICVAQKETNWGDGLIGQIEQDLKLAFPGMLGFSRRNLLYMKQFYLFLVKDEKVQQLVAQIPWGHIILIMTKIKDMQEALFYVQKTIENSWSRVILDHQIDLKLYARQGKLLSNFEQTIEPHELDIVVASFKESYILDFLQLEELAKEKDMEKAMMQHVCAFMLEFGRGFAFVGKQFKLNVGDQEFFVDLLFYHYILKRFVVIELKTSEFKPEYAGQIGFYITAIDRDVKGEHDKGTIGLIICKTKHATIVEYALGSSTHPLGVAEYKLSELPSDIASYLPSEDDIRYITK